MKNNQNSNTGTKILLAGVAVAAVVAIAAWAIDVDVTGDLEMPTVTADVEGGELPAVDVNVVDVDVKEKRATIKVPTDVSVKTEEKSIPYPAIDVTSPEENKVAEENDLK